MKDNRIEFEKLLNSYWETTLFYKGHEDWKSLWFLDGKKAIINNTDKGMEFYAGEKFLDDSCNAVLWTKQDFIGDIKIEYEYTRLDNEYRCVNILYLQATGMGEKPYVKDIAQWQNLREIPSMSLYYEKMHAYHISYAAFTNNDEFEPGYIRARRYIANKLDGTELYPDYEPSDFFEYGVPHKIIVIKSNNHLYLKISNQEKSLLCHWHNTELPLINEGKIGIRHMFTRAARYTDFSVSVK